MDIKRNSLAVPLIKIVGVKNSGKTTLVEKLIRSLKRRGYKVAGMKHSSHSFEFDRENTDSFRISRAGCVATCAVNPKGFFITGECTDLPTVESYFRCVVPDADLILSEGNKREAGPKIEISRQDSKEGPLCLNDKDLIALVTDREDIRTNRPVFHPDDIEGMAEFIEKTYFH